MGKASDALQKFIEGIPDEKLEGFRDPSPAYTAYRSQDYRLDVQGLTSDDPPLLNIQVQVNKETKISTLKKQIKKNKKSGTTVSIVLVPTDGSWNAATVRQALLKNAK